MAVTGTTQRAYVEEQVANNTIDDITRTLFTQPLFRLAWDNISPSERAMITRRWRQALLVRLGQMR